MPSTYTTSGVELIATGEQSGTWGTTTNTNLQILDRMISQAGTISLSGTTHTLTVSDGTLSDGQYAVLVFGGSPSGTNTVTISPSDAKRVFIVKNDSGQTVTLTQGSGGNVSVANGRGAIVYCDGAGAGAAVVNASDDLVAATLSAIAALTPADGNFIVGNGTTWVTESGNTALTSLGVTATATELNTLDGITATTTELNYTDGVTSNIQTQLNGKAATTTTISAGEGLTGGGSLAANRTISHADTSSQASVNNSGTTVIQDVTLDTYGHVTALGSATLSLGSFGVTATSSELNVLDGVTATTAELNILDGVTATTTELNYTDGVTSNIQTQLNGKAATTTTISAGEGLTGGGSLAANRTISHADTSSQASVNNSGTTVIQDVTLDTYGHVTALGSATLSLGSFGVTATSSELNVLDGVTASTAELNVLDGITATTAELNYTDGVTSNIQTQLNGKAALAGSASQAFSASTLNAVTVDLGAWTVTESSGVLFFAHNGANKMKLDSGGNLTVTGNITAYGTV